MDKDGGRAYPPRLTPSRSRGRAPRLFILKTEACSATASSLCSKALCRDFPSARPLCVSFAPIPPTHGRATGLKRIASLSASGARLRSPESRTSMPMPCADTKRLRHRLLVNNPASACPSRPLRPVRVRGKRGTPAPQPSDHAEAAGRVRACQPMRRGGRPARGGGHRGRLSCMAHGRPAPWQTDRGVSAAMSLRRTSWRSTF